MFTKPVCNRILEDACAWTVALAMFIYGAAKGVQYRAATAIEKPLAEFTGQGSFRQKAFAFLLTFVLLAILRIFEYFITH